MRGSLWNLVDGNHVGQSVDEFPQRLRSELGRILISRSLPELLPGALNEHDGVPNLPRDLQLEALASPNGFAKDLRLPGRCSTS